MEQDLVKRVRHTSQEIKTLLEEFTQANISAKEFCMLHTISEAVFYKWRSRYGGSPSANKTNFIALKAPSVSLHQAALFAEVNGIRIYQAVEASYLKELL